MCEQLAQGRYLTAKRPRVELATSRVARQRLNHYITRSHTWHTLNQKGNLLPYFLTFIRVPDVVLCCTQSHSTSLSWSWWSQAGIKVGDASTEMCYLDSGQECLQWRSRVPSGQHASSSRTIDSGAADPWNATKQFWPQSQGLFKVWKSYSRVLTRRLYTTSTSWSRFWWTSGLVCCWRHGSTVFICASKPVDNSFRRLHLCSNVRTYLAPSNRQSFFHRRATCLECTAVWHETDLVLHQLPQEAQDTLFQSHPVENCISF